MSAALAPDPPDAEDALVIVAGFKEPHPEVVAGVLTEPPLVNGEHEDPIVKDEYFLKKNGDDTYGKDEENISASLLTTQIHRYESNNRSALNGDTNRNYTKVQFVMNSGTSRSYLRYQVTYDDSGTSSDNAKENEKFDGT